jgi:low affinity Fe/Cu permease
MLFMLAVLLFIAIVGVRDGFAVIYKYIDSNGVPSFTDDLLLVPDKYRAKAVVVDDELAASQQKKLSRQDSLSEKSGSREQNESITRERNASLSRRALWSACALAAFVFVLFILHRLDGFSKHAKLLSFTRTALGLTVSFYVLFNHAEDMIRIFSKVDKKIMQAKEHSAKRGEKLAQEIKSAEALWEETQKEARPEENSDK